MESLAITDHGSLYGGIEFFIKAQERGIKPIIGCEMYITPNDLHSKNPDSLDRKRNHLVILAKNMEGYKNLMKLISISHLEGFYYKPRIDRQTLKKYSAGLIGLSACTEGEVPSAAISGDMEKAEKLALEYQEIFGKGDFYLELQCHPKYPNQQIANEALKKIAQKYSIPLIATNDVHYVKKDDAGIHDILLCIQTNRKVQEENRMNLMDFELYLKSPEEMEKNFKDVPEAISNTQEIVAKCDLQIKMGETQLPHFDVPDGFSAESYLRHLTENGLQKKFKDVITKEHLDRMEYELGVIEKTGFASYFLIVQDFVNWAKNQGIVVGPGRGSAAGSFVSYLIGITNMDPIKYDLLFERFLNPERISMPDVDMDFADDRRDEVLDYVRKKYGNDHVAQIITFGTMAARAAIRDAGRALGIPYELCDKTAKLIPMFSSIEDALINSKEFKNMYSESPDSKKLIDSAKRLEGVVRHASMHACGVVITKDPVTEYSPLQNIIGKEGEGTVTQYSSSTKSSFVEKIGLLKIDFLGLKNLTIIQNTLRIVKKTKGSEINIDDIPLDDKKTYELLQRAETTGVFQLESSGMKRYLKQLKPNNLEDIIAMVALYRPGPMDWIPDFIDRKHGRKEMSYLHPKLKSILEKTYGVAVYQEQVMQIARDLAGFSLGEADVLRKAMGKKIFALIQEQKYKFIDGCVKQGIDKKIGEKVFAFIEPFAGYGFNRSHAACYALIGYQTAYLKAHFPAAFMAALLTSDQNDSDRVAIEISECRDMGIEILPPHINESFEEFAVIPDPENKVERIRFGLNAIKNVGKNVAHEIVEERKRNGKFKNITDFVERVMTKDLNKKSIEALAKVGGLKGMGERNQILTSIENILIHSKKFQSLKDSNQISLFGDSVVALPEIKLSDAPAATKRERLSWEKELLGLYISDHPVKEYREYFKKMAVPIREINSQMVENNINIGGVISKIHKIYLKNQKTMLFVTIEDMEGSMEILVFPKVLEATESFWQEDKIVLASGKLSNKDGEFKLLCDSIKAIGQDELDKFQRILATQKSNGTAFDKCSGIILSFPENSGQESIKKLSEFFARCDRGETKVYLNINNSKLETPYRIKFSAELKNSLEKIIPDGKIKIV
jgi:DNA polymerase-3 subunit alpha